MYQYPYGDGQQLNLNWIINEIIQLRKQLDPDYTEPSFSQIYPFSNTEQLNLDWILAELKVLKELTPEPTPTPGIDLDEVGKALLAAEYDATKSYQKNDYITRDGQILRASAATTGTFDATKWQAVKLGDDLAIITRWADAMDAYINSLKASQIANDSTVDGANVDDALDNLKGAINSVENSIAIISNNNSHDAIAKGQYVYIKNHGTLAEGLYQNSTNAAIPQNQALTTANVTAVSDGGLNAFVGKKLTPVLDALFAPSTPLLMEADTNYPLLSGILPINNYVGFVWNFYPTASAITANKITLNELIGVANVSHYSLATSPTGQIRIRHSLLDTYYDFTSSDSTLYLHRIYGIRYEIN